MESSCGFSLPKSILPIEEAIERINKTFQKPIGSSLPGPFASCVLDKDKIKPHKDLLLGLEGHMVEGTHPTEGMRYYAFMTYCKYNGWEAFLNAVKKVPRDEMVRQKKELIMRQLTSMRIPTYTVEKMDDLDVLEELSAPIEELENTLRNLLSRYH